MLELFDLRKLLSVRRCHVDDDAVALQLDLSRRQLYMCLLAQTVLSPSAKISDVALAVRFAKACG